MKRSFSRTLPLLAVLVSTACSPVYYLRASYEQARILSRRQAIPTVIAHPATEPTTRSKLQLVLEARDYAAHVLDLDVGQSYTTFAQLDRDTLLLVLSGSRKDRFQAHTWRFPFVGRVPYKGFFDASAARRERDALQEQGLDTHLRPAGAFSTLGWFNDPLLSTLLRLGDVSLANTVIHEVTHNTFYAPGQAQFNESFATFVGGRGAVAFFCQRDGENAPRCRQALDQWHDELVFGHFLSSLVGELESLYDRQDLTSAQKIELREEIFGRAQREFASEVRPRFRIAEFRAFDREPLNNATLIARRLYYHRLDLFDRVLERHGGDLKRTITAVIEAARASRDDPYAGVEALLGPGL